MKMKDHGSGKLRFFYRSTNLKILSIVILCIVVLSIPSTALSKSWWIFGKKKDDNKITSAELQSIMMSYSDRFATIMASAFFQFEASKIPHAVRNRILSNLTYTLSAVLTISAEANPDVALLDMIVLITLSRMVYEDHWRTVYGSSVDEIINGFRILEEDIWEIADQVLQQSQKDELMLLITEWRRKNPNDFVVSYLRFGDFAAQRKRSKLADSVKSSGFLSPVSDATKEIEETRMLAERALFLGTRLPLLMGTFADIWVSNTLLSPDIQEILTDLHNLSYGLKRLGNLAEQLPDMVVKERNKTIDLIFKRFEKEREKTINQAMKEITTERKATLTHLAKIISSERKKTVEHVFSLVSEERKKTINDFIAQEQKINGLLTTIKEIMKEGNNLALSVDVLASRLGFEPGQQKKDLIINDYKQTLAEASMSVNRLNTLLKTTEGLLNSPGFKKLFSLLEMTVEHVGDKTEKIINHIFKQAVFLMLIGFGGYIATRIIVQFFLRKFFSES